METSSFHSALVRIDGTVSVKGAVAARFPWWSFTKTALAICALRLVEDGLVDLDALRPRKPFTLRQLLQHRAGVPEYGWLPSYHEAVARQEPPWSRRRLLEAVGADRLDFEPGTGWAYSNVGYLFVREMIEEITGLDLAAALRQFVTGPLELASVQLATKLSDFDDVYWPSRSGYDPAWVYHGCLTGTPLDAATMLHALFSGRILRPDSLQSMLESHPVGGAIPGRPWTLCGYGLGLMSGEMAEIGRAIGHSGSGPFCTNAVYYFPDASRPVTVATFTDSSEEGRAEFEAVRLALGDG
jgi:CubicO group peptidase (beta-lactamase class C family)